MAADADAKRAIVRKLVEEFKDQGWDKAWSVCMVPQQRPGIINQSTPGKKM